MKENEFLDGVSNIEPDVVERFVTMDNNLHSRSRRSRSVPRSWQNCLRATAKTSTFPRCSRRLLEIFLKL
jgi:hypothetical protein